MKLYYAPGTCSLAAHIVLAALDIPHTLERVDFKTKKTETGRDFNAINPKSYVPTLELDDGSILTECPAILTYIADQKPESGWNPPFGTMERIRVLEWLVFVGTEIHKNFFAIFNPNAPDSWKSIVREIAKGRLAYANSALQGKTYLVTDHPTIADAYFFVVTRWIGHLGFDPAQFPEITAFQSRMAALPAVRKAMETEGLPV